MTSRTPVASKKRKGFTMLELITAVVILAILSAVALPVWTSLQNSSQLSATASQLAALGSDARANAIANGRTLPNAADLATAAAEVPSLAAVAGLEATGAPTIVTSTSASPVASTVSGTVSADVSSGSSVGLSMAAKSGGCVMALVTTTKISSWFYQNALGTACSGTQATQGPNQANPGLLSAPVITSVVGVNSNAVGTGGAQVTWTAPTSLGGSTVTSYVVSYTDSTESAWPANTSMCVTPAQEATAPNGPNNSLYSGASAAACTTTATTLGFYPGWYTAGNDSCTTAGNLWFFADNITFYVTVYMANGQSARSAGFSVPSNTTWQASYSGC